MNSTRKVCNRRVAGVLTCLRPLLSGMLVMAGSLAHAQSVSVSPVSPHPQAAVAVAGAHFADSEAVDVYFDTVDTLLLVSTSTGTFSGTVTVPASAAPGKHYVTAIGRRSGDAAQGVLTVTTPWVEFGYGAGHRGWNPYENTVNSDNVAQLGVLWSAPVVGAGGTPAVSSGTAYVGTLAGVAALSTTTGAVLWTAEAGDTFYASPAVAAGVVYAVGYSSETLYALAAGTGAQKWSHNLGAESLTSPVVVAGVVYVAAGGTLYAFKASTGSLVWSYSNVYSGASPTVANGTLYIGCTTGLCALNALTGALEWSTSNVSGVVGSPAVAGGVVYVASNDGYVYAIAAGAYYGNLLWSYDVANAGQGIGEPAVAYGTVYIAAFTGGLYALDAKFGALVWSNNSAEFGNSAISLANGLLYITDYDGYLLALDPYYGGILASWDTGYNFDDGGTAAISDGVVYMSGEYGYPTALSLLAGTDVVRSKPRAPEISALHPDLTLEVTQR